MRALEILEEGLSDATAVLALPGRYGRRLRTTNMMERLIERVCRREKVIRIFPNKSPWLLVRALLGKKTQGAVNWTGLAEGGRVQRVARGADRNDRRRTTIRTFQLHYTARLTGTTRYRRLASYPHSHNDKDVAIPLFSAGVKQ